MKNIKTLFGLTAIVVVIMLALGSCIINVPDDGSDGLAAPRGLTATGISSSEIHLFWNEVDGASGYYVYQRNSSMSDFIRRSETVTSNWATNTGLQPNTTMYYQISAYANGQEGARSSVVSATTLSAGNYSIEGNWFGASGGPRNGMRLSVSGSTGVISAFGNTPFVLDAANIRIY
jgi:hypothetical protein